MRKTPSARLLRRLQAVGLAAEGRAAKEIAAVVGASRRSVIYWLAAYRAAPRRQPPLQLGGRRREVQGHHATQAVAHDDGVVELGVRGATE